MKKPVLLLLIFSFSILNGQSYEKFKVLSGHNLGVTHLAFNHKSNLLYSGDNEGYLFVWNILQGKLIGKIRAHTKRITHIAFNQELTVTAGYDGLIKIWNSNNLELLDSIIVPSIKPYDDINGNEPTFVTYSSTKNLLFFGGYNSMISQFSFYNKSVDNLFEDKEFGITCGIMDHAERYLIFSSGAITRILDTSSGKISHLIASNELDNEDNYVCELGINKDELLAIWLYGGRVKLYDIKKGITLGVLKTTNKKGAKDVVFNQNGNLLLTGSNNNDATIWNVSDFTINQILTNHQDEVTTYSFSPDDRFIATGSKDNNIIIWKIDTLNKYLSRISNRNSEIQQIITVKHSYIDIELWDNKQIDNDVITVFFNEKKVLSKHSLSKEKRQLRLNLNKGVNTIILYANNLGKAPPNTIGATLIYDGIKTDYTFTSDKSKNAAIVIERK